MKRISSLLLALCMMLTMSPVQTFAQQETAVSNNNRAIASTPVFVEDFNYGSTYLTSDTNPESSKELRTLAPDGIVVTGGIGNTGKYTYLVPNPDSADTSDGVLKFLDKTQITTNYDVTEVNRYITSDANSRYVVYSQKIKMGASSTRFSLYTSHKAKVNSGINPDKNASATANTADARLSLLIDGRNASNPIKGGASGDSAIASEPTVGKFLNRWVDMEIIIDALNWTYTLYIDGIKVNSTPMPLNTSGVDTSKNYINGISRIKFFHDRWSGGGGNSWYHDDLTVSSMTEAQFEFMAIAGLTAPAEEVYTGMVLPSSADGIALTWSCDNASVTISNNIVTVKNDFSDYANFTAATPNGATKTFKIKVGSAQDSKPDIFKGSKLIADNSNQVFAENFDNKGVEANGAKIRDLVDGGLIKNFSYTGSRDSTYTDALLVKNSLTDYYYSIQNWKTGTASAYAYYTYGGMKAMCESDYIIFSSKMKIDSGFRCRLYFNGYKKALNNGAYNPSAAGSEVSEFVSLYIDNRDSGNNTFKNEFYKPNGSEYIFNEAKPMDFNGEWVDAHFVFSAKDNMFTFYINGVAFAQSGFKTSMGSGNYLAGINGFFVQDDKWGHYTAGNGISFDDVKVRSMSAAQYEQFKEAIRADITVPEKLLANEDTLPLKSNEYEIPITWVCDNSNVTISPSGEISLASNVTKAENVTLTATAWGLTKDFTVTVEGDLEVLGSDESEFVKKSERVKSINFDSGSFTKDGVLKTTVEAEKFSPYYRDSNFYSSTPKTDRGNLGLLVYRDLSKYGNSVSTQYDRWTTEAVTDSQFIVASYKSKSNNTYDRLFFNFYYDDLTNGKIVPDADAGITESTSGLPMVFRNDKIQRDVSDFSEGAYDCDNKKSFTSGQYLDAWHTYTYVIDAINKKAYLFIDDNYLMSLAIARESSAGNIAEDTDKYISGIRYIEIAQDRYGTATDGGKILKTYYDDFYIRKMSAEQLKAVLGDDIKFTSSELTTDDKLPLNTKVYKAPIKWSTAHKSVIITNDGSIALAGVSRVENVALTANILGAEKTFIVSIEGDEVQTEESGMEAHNDGIDWWTLVKEKGVYVSASAPNAGTGMAAQTASKLYDLDNAEDVAELGNTTINGKTAAQIKALGYKYATPHNTDSGANVSFAISGDGIYKRTFFTSRNYRNNSSWNDIPGYLYFKVTSNDKITAADTDVYVVIEYLDYDENMGTSQNSNGTFYYKNQSTIVPVFAVKPNSAKEYPLFRRHNTNTWKTIAIPVSDADINSTNNATALVDNTFDIRICANKVDTHISRIGVVKASDVGALAHTYHAPGIEGQAPQIFLAGDSIVEQLDIVKAYPRTGWGMELGKYFKNKTISSVAASYDANDYKVTSAINQGVTIVNRAKGGKSTRTFLNQVDPTNNATATDTRWSDIKSMAKKGDYLFVSFLINDVANRTTVQTNPYLVGDEGDRFSHRANIREFKDTCDQLGINLVLLTPAANRGTDSTSDAHIASLHAQGRELGVPVIDVNTYHKALIKSFRAANDDAYATDKTKLIFNYILDEAVNAEYNTGYGLTDDTHINQKGADEICKIIVQEIQRKASDFASMNALSAWVNTSKDITTITAPVHQTPVNIRYDVYDAKYIVDGQERDDYKKGEVAYSATVTNSGNEVNDAYVYLALYGASGELVDVAKSEKATIEPGKSATVTTSAITVPDFDGYKLRKFIWNGAQKPYDDGSATVMLYADGSNRRAYLEWKLNKNLGDVTFDIYRDNLLIASTTNGGYIDEGVDRGEHTYQINVVKDGAVIQQSPVAVATVTNLYEIKQDSAVHYVKANLNSMNQKAHMSSGLTVVNGGTVVFTNEAVEAFKLSQSDINASYGSTEHKFQGSPLVANSSSDASHMVVRVKDSKGVEKTAFAFGSVYITSAKYAQLTHLYVDEADTAAFSSSDSTVTVFAEFLASQNPPTLEYATGTGSTKTVNASAFSGTNGDWRIARYEITDASFTDSTKLKDNSLFRFKGEWGTVAYISSIAVVKGDMSTASAKFANLNNLEFNEYNVRGASDKYPDGVSIDFSTGTAVKNGMDVYYSTSGSSDNKGEITKADDGVGYFGTTQAITEDGAFKNTYLYFGVDKEYLLGGNDKLVLDITYKADYETELSMIVRGYDKKSGWVSSGSTTMSLGNLQKDTVDNWKTAQFIVDKTNLMYLDNYGAAFRLSVPQSRDDVNKQLRISKIRIRNLDGAPLTGGYMEASKGKTTIHIAADSIAATYSESETAANGIMGWGQVIGDYLNGDLIKINNKAKPGASTRTFSNMPAILDAAKEGDYVLISFGHNDQENNEKHVPIEDYKANITNWINQIREKKAVPVLVTMIPQGHGPSGTLLEKASFDERRAAVAEVANATDTMLVKLGEQMFIDEDNGMFTPEQYKAMYCNEGWDNRTHVTEAGARYIAQIIVAKLSEASKYFGTFVK